MAASQNSRRYKFRVASRLLLGICVWSASVGMPTAAEAGKSRGRARILQRGRWNSPSRSAAPAVRQISPASTGKNDSQGGNVSALAGGTTVPYPVFHYGNSQKVDTASDGDGWVYNEGDGKWEPGAGGGGGASSLGQLNDVTTTGAQTGDFLVKTETDWEPATVTIPADVVDLGDWSDADPDEGDVPVWDEDGAEYVPTALSIPVNIQDLGDDDAAQEGDVPIWDDMAGKFVPGPQTGGEGLDATGVTIGYVPTADGENDWDWAAPASGGPDATGIAAGWVYTAQGDNTAEFAEPPAASGLDATGVDTGKVPTADGANGWDWDAPVVGGLLTPDGATAVTASAVYNPASYGASYLDTNAYVTSATTTEECTADASTNVVTTANAHGLTDGDGIVLATSDTLPAPLAADARYFARVLSGTTFTLHATRAAALANTGAVDITDTGTGTHTARLKTTVTLNNAAGSADAAANDYEVGHGLLLYFSGPAPTITAPQETVDGVTATYGTKVGADPTWTFDDATDVLTLSSTATPLATGDAVRLTTSGSLPTGVDVDTDYFARRIGGVAPTLATTISLHPTAEDAVANTNKIAITGGSGTHTIVGRTAHYCGVRASDGEGGFSAAYEIGPVYHWNYVNAGSPTYGVKWTAHLPIGSRGNVFYVGGASGRKLGTFMDGTGVRRDSPAFFNEVDDYSSAQTNGGLTRLNGSGYTAQLNEIMEVKTRTGGDYTGQYKVTDAGTASNFTLNVAFSSSGTGLISRGQQDWIDFGAVNTLQAVKGMPAVENRRWGRMAGVTCPIGTNVVDLTNDRLWQVYDTTTANGTYFMNRSGTSNPSWSSATGANDVVADGTLQLKRAIHFVPLADTGGAVRRVLRSEVQSRTSTTITLRDAAFADLETNTLALAHDDTMALRRTFAAMNAHGRSATLELSAGTLAIYPPKVGTVDPDGVAWWTAVGTSNSQYALYVFGGGDRTRDMGVIAHPGSTIRVRPFETKQRINDRTLTNGQPTLFSLSCGRFRCASSRIIFHDWAGGISEHDDGTSYEAGLQGFTNLNTAAGYISCHDIQFDGLEFWGHQFATWTGTSDGQKFFVSSKTLLRNCIIGFGGGDGNANFFQGDFESDNTRYIAHRYLSSHCLYGNVGKRWYRSRGDTFAGVTTSGKYAVHLYGESALTPVAEFVMSDAFFPTGGTALIGHSSTSNPIHNPQIVNCRGATISMAEVRNAQLANIIGDVVLNEDCRGVQITNLIGDLTANVDRGVHGLQVEGVACDYLWLSHLYGSRVSGVRWRNNAVENKVSLVNEQYAWVATGAGTNEYELRLRSTGGSPGIAQPARLLMNGHVVTPNGTLGSLVVGQAGWGASADGSFNTVHVRMHDASFPDPDSHPHHIIQACDPVSEAITVGRWVDSTFENFSYLRTDGSNSPFLGWTGSSSHGWNNSWMQHGVVRWYGTATGSTARGFDFGMSERLFLDSGLRDVTIRQRGDAGGGQASPITARFRDNSTPVFERVASRYMTGSHASAGWNIQGGRGKLIECEIQDNRMLVSFDADTDVFTLVTAAQLEGTCGGTGSSTTIVLSADALTYDDAYNYLPIIVVQPNGLVEETYISDYVGATKTATLHDALENTPSTQTRYFISDTNLCNDLITANGVPIRFRAETMPTGFTAERVYWTHNTTQKAWTGQAAAASASDSDFADVTTNGVVIAEVVDLANDAYFFANEPITGNLLSWVAEARGNKLRGSETWTYAQLTGSVGDKQLQPVLGHLFSSDNDSNAITGLLGLMTAGDRRLIGCRTDSTNDVVLDHQDSPTSTTLVENEINSPTGADLALDPGEVKWVFRATPFDRLQVEGN